MRAGPAPPSSSLATLPTSPASALSGAGTFLLVNARSVQPRYTGPAAVGIAAVCVGGAGVVLSLPLLAVAAGAPALVALRWAYNQFETPKVQHTTITLDVGQRALRIVEGEATRAVPLGGAVSVLLETYDGMTSTVLKVGLRSWTLSGSPGLTPEDAVKVLSALGVRVRTRVRRHQRASYAEPPDLGVGP